MSLDRLWASWREQYLETVGVPRQEGCVFCGLIASNEPGEITKVVHATNRVAVILNAFPYGSGHLMVMPRRHIGLLGELNDVEHVELWETVRHADLALRSAYSPGGINIGVNEGKAAGAGIPGHLHVHLLPRWDGDSNFMTSIAETRVLPESLDTTYKKVKAAWRM